MGSARRFPCSVEQVCARGMWPQVAPLLRVHLSTALLLAKRGSQAPGQSVPRPVPQPLRPPKNWYKGANASLFWLHTSCLVLVSFLFTPSPARTGSSALLERSHCGPWGRTPLSITVLEGQGQWTQDCSALCRWAQSERRIRSSSLLG